MKIGIDLGGTKIELVAIDSDSQIQIRRRVATPQGDYGKTLQLILELVVVTEDDLGQKCSVGVGIPGSPSPKTGLIRNANSTCLNGKDFTSDLEHVLDRQIRLANDANCFALSEALTGAGRGALSVFGVIIGTGCGGGVVIDGKLLEGRNAIAGEWGHTRMPWLAREEITDTVCYCGKFDCTETFLSGTGWASRHNQRFQTNLSAQEIARLAAAGEENAQVSLRQYVDWLARGLASVINLLDPEVIVLGGGMSNISCLYEGVHERLSEYVFSDVIQTAIVPPAHGDSSGVLGAALLW